MLNSGCIKKSRTLKNCAHKKTASESCAIILDEKCFGATCYATIYMCNHMNVIQNNL